MGERIATPGSIRNLVERYGFRVKKSLGQNFLVEPRFIDKIVEAARLDKKQIVVEIGPGMGSLTQALTDSAGYLVAVELDRVLASIMQENFSHVTNITIIHGDAMKEDFDALTNNVPNRDAYLPGYKIVANLPYYITTPLIMRILEGKFAFSSLVFMVQKEVAQRMMALPGSKDYGALSIGVQYYCTPSLVTVVPRTVFYPRPEVESAVVKLDKREKPPVDVNNEALMFRLVKGAFGQRRKTLLNALSHYCSEKTKEEWVHILHDSDIDPQRRGETLTIQEFSRIADNIDC